MRLPRPYIPLSVRVTVAVRQAIAAGIRPYDILEDRAYSKQLRVLLRLLFGDKPVHLDHHPPLMLRMVQKRDGKIIRYFPDANDPDYLIYRTKADHDIKTRVRGDGAQHSDHALARKNKRIKRNRDPKRRVVKIAQRKNPWPKRPMRPTGRSVR